MARSLDNPTLADAFDGLRADYDAARESRFRRNRAGVSGTPRSGDYHCRSEADLMRTAELSEDFARNDPIVAQGIRRLVQNVVQEGMVPDATTPDEKLNRDLEATWREWAEDAEACDVAGERTFAELQEAVVYAMAVPGDCCLLPTREGLEFMEYQRLRTPTNLRRDRNIVHGVQLDARRRRLAYYFTNDELDPLSSTVKLNETRTVDTRARDGQRQVYHCYRNNRVSLTRGISQMAPVADVAGMHGDVQFAKLVQQQIVSCFALIEELPLEFRGGKTKQLGSRETATRDDGTTATQEQIAPGMRITGRRGAKLKGFSPNVPNPEFFPHATLLLTFIAINLDLPLAVLLLEPKGSFSAWRGAIDQARIGFKAIQRWLIRKFCRPAYAWKLAQFAARDPVLFRAMERLGTAFYAHQWQSPRWPYIEPLTDASADVFRMRNLLSSPSEIVAERGGQWSRLVDSTIADNSLAIRQAKARAEAINRDFPDDPDRVSWREILSLPTPDKVNVSLSRNEQGQDQGQGQPARGPSRAQPEE